MTLESFWVWLIIGFLFLASELLSGAFVLVFFGIAALATSALAAFGITNIALLVCFFALISFLNLMLFRKRLLKAKGLATGIPFSADAGKTLILTERIAANAEGVVNYQGVPWSAVNMEPVPLEKGTMVRIVKTEGIKLYIQQEK